MDLNPIQLSIAYALIAAVLLGCLYILARRSD